jgi:Mlc titration factor MtfA (ptsG expression regulator)
LIENQFDIKWFLAKNNPYYQKLNLSGKTLFIKRVENFIDLKVITGRQNFIVTPEVKITIAASAVQLTLGLDTWDLSYFKQILIYPDEYKNPQTSVMHKGETNLGGFMCFSWRDFVSGNQTQNDKINLGLHEFAHALRFNGINGSDTDYFFENYFKRWLACANIEFNKIRKGELSIFRKYGAVNINEFFSVLVETFFEAPLEFKKYFPELYIQTSILLNQTLSDDDHVILNCRENLMKENSAKLSSNFDNTISYKVPFDGAMIMGVLFFIVGFFSLFGDGYKYPSPYILFGIAIICLLYSEKKYTRIIFGTTTFKIEKGFLLLKGFKSETLPLSHLISLYVGYEHTDHKNVKSMEITYYYNGDFYQDELYCRVSQPQFDLLCSDLIKNFVHVFIKD